MLASSAGDSFDKFRVDFLVLLVTRTCDDGRDLRPMWFNAWQTAAFAKVMQVFPRGSEGVSIEVLDILNGAVYYGYGLTAPNVLAVIPEGFGMNCLQARDAQCRSLTYQRNPRNLGYLAMFRSVGWKLQKKFGKQVP